jgi:hypothetical protein
MLFSRLSSAIRAGAVPNPCVAGVPSTHHTGGDWMSRMLALFSVLSLGVVALFGFFAVLGEVSPGDVMALTIVLAVLLVAFSVHAFLVRRNLRRHGNQEFFRALNRLRERRGF